MLANSYESGLRARAPAGFPWLGRKFPFTGQDLGSPVLASAPSYLLWVSFYQSQTEILSSTWPLSGICQMSRSQKTGSFSTVLVVQPTVWSRVVRQPGSPSRNFNCQQRNLAQALSPPFICSLLCLEWNWDPHLYFSGVEGAWHLPNLPFFPSASVLLPINCPLRSLSQVLAIISHILQMRKRRHRDYASSTTRVFPHAVYRILAFSLYLGNRSLSSKGLSSLSHSLTKGPPLKGVALSKPDMLEHSTSQEQLALLLSSFLQSRELLIQQEAEWV